MLIFESNSGPFYWHLLVGLGGQTSPQEASQSTLMTLVTSNDSMDRIVRFATLLFSRPPSIVSATEADSLLQLVSHARRQNDNKLSKEAKHVLFKESEAVNALCRALDHQEGSLTQLFSQTSLMSFV